MASRTWSSNRRFGRCVMTMYPGLGKTKQNSNETSRVGAEWDQRRGVDAIPATSFGVPRACNKQGKTGHRTASFSRFEAYLHKERGYGIIPYVPGGLAIPLPIGSPPVECCWPEWGKNGVKSPGFPPNRAVLVPETWSATIIWQ